MPKDPIQRRTLLYQTLRDGTLMLLDFNLVQTSLGLMVEPRTMNRASGAMVNEDVYDSNFTEIMPITEAEQAALSVHDLQWPRIFNTL